MNGAPRIKFVFAVALSLSVLGLKSRSSQAAEGELVFLAIDDQTFAWQHNLELTPVKADKYAGNPVLRRGAKGTPDHGHAILYGTVIHDGEKFRMWYLGMFDRDVTGGAVPGWYRPMLYAESLNGMEWTKPNLGLVTYNGNKNNNICRIKAEVDSMTKVNDFLTVIVDEEDPDPARRYKVAYIAHMPYDDIKGGMSNVGEKEPRIGAIVTATSADGLSWQVVGDRPANAGGERFEVSGLYKFGKFYYASGQLCSPWAWLKEGRPVGRLMQTYRSPDFKTWNQAKATSMVLSQQYTDPQSFDVPELLTGYGLQMHMGASCWNRGNVLIGMHGIWNSLPETRPEGSEPLHGLRIDLGLSISNDGVTFREVVPGFELLEHGGPSDWDSIALLQAHAFVNVDDKTYIWYSHWDAEGKYRNEEIGLATLRRDGFGYLSRHAEGEAGYCVSTVVPAATGGKQLFVNVSGVDQQHPLKVELVDELDRPIPGFSGDSAAKISEIGTRVAVNWRSAESRTPKNTPFALKLTLPDRDSAQFYAAYVTD